MERENQRIVITKRMLKESMLRILKEKELDAVSVTELCREAGLNRATFYRHYEIPRDVLIEIQKDFYYELRSQIDLPRHMGELRQVIDKLCTHMYEHLELLRILIRSNSDTDFVVLVNDIFVELIREFGHLDAVKELSREDVELLSLYTAGGSYFVLRSWILGSIRKSPREMTDYLTELLEKTRGLLISSLSEPEISAG